MLDSIMKFIGPILAQILSGAGSAAAGAGINALMGPKQQATRMAPAQGAGMVPGAPPGVSGSGSTSNPTGTLNFGGGYTGGPDPRAQAGPQGPPSSGFTTMGFPTADQARMKKMLEGDRQGFQGI